MCSPRIYFYRLVIWEWLMLNVQKGQLEIDLKVQKVQRLQIMKKQVVKTQIMKTPNCELKMRSNDLN